MVGWMPYRSQRAETGVCSRRWSRRMAAFSWTGSRFRVFLGMGGPPLEVVAYSSRRLVPFQLKQNTVIYASVYFPTFSNGLKDVGRYLGCNWTDENASGLQSLVWRARWAQARDQCWKDKLLTYNAEDCAALRKVAEFVQAVGEAVYSRGGPGD